MASPEVPAIVRYAGMVAERATGIKFARRFRITNVSDENLPPFAAAFLGWSFQSGAPAWTRTEYLKARRLLPDSAPKIGFAVDLVNWAIFLAVAEHFTPLPHPGLLSLGIKLGFNAITHVVADVIEFQRFHEMLIKEEF